MYTAVTTQLHVNYTVFRKNTQSRFLYYLHE